MFQGDSNSYTSHSGNSYTYTYITNNFDHSFNTSHSNNGHGRGGWCGIVAVALVLGIPILVIWFMLSVLSEVLR